MAHVTNFFSHFQKTFTYQPSALINTPSSQIGVNNFCKYPRCLHNVSPVFIQTALGIAEYIQQNWQKILVYLIAWALVISCTGALNGFQTTALPLALGLGIGFGVGIITGIITGLIIDKNNKYTDKNTLWGLLTFGFYQLDVYGTRQILLALLIAVLATAIGLIPQILGGFFGFCLGNSMATKLIYTIKKNDKKVLHNPVEEFNGSTKDPIFISTFNTLATTVNKLQEENAEIKTQLASMETMINNIQINNPPRVATFDVFSTLTKHNRTNSSSI